MLTACPNRQELFRRTKRSERPAARMTPTIRALVISEFILHRGRKKPRCRSLAGIGVARPEFYIILENVCHDETWEDR